MYLRHVFRRFTATSASALTKPRRFYKSVDVNHEDIQGRKVYKVTLDGRTLKTQGGNVLKVESEPLALAIAEEWSSQEEFLLMNHMRLTGLAFTAQDNPMHMTRLSLTAKILEYLHGDTILFWNDESTKLERYQKQYWQPVIDHVNDELGTSLKPSTNLLETALNLVHYSTLEMALLRAMRSGDSRALFCPMSAPKPQNICKAWLWSHSLGELKGVKLLYEVRRDTDIVSEDDANKVEKYLLSYNFWSLIGMQYAVESVKSVLLPYSVITFKMTASEAVDCALMEQKAQVETWGSVEWAHDIEKEELTARLAAASLFVYFNSNAVTKVRL